MADALTTELLTSPPAYRYEDGILYVRTTCREQTFRDVRKIVLLNEHACVLRCVFFLAADNEAQSIREMVEAPFDAAHSLIEGCFFAAPDRG